MKKYIFLCLALLCLLPLAPIQTQAAENLDIYETCSLTLQYKQQDQGLADLEIAIYRVGEVFSSGKYALIAPYDSYPVQIQGVTSTKEWQDIAATLQAYISADQLQPEFIQTTDEEGVAAFTKLNTGLYLVCGVTCETESVACLFDDFLIFLPGSNETEFIYDVQAQPKFSRFVSTEEMAEYSVLKLWKDMDAGIKRPASVQIDILKDGQLQERVDLNEENGWNHTWQAPAGELWSVVERQVPEGYTVTVSEEDTTFVVTNTFRKETPDRPEVPKTGDTTPILLYVLLICLSGFGLLILGIALMRGKRHEKKR